MNVCILRDHQPTFSLEAFELDFFSKLGNHAVALQLICIACIFIIFSVTFPSFSLNEVFCMILLPVEGRPLISQVRKAKVTIFVLEVRAWQDFSPKSVSTLVNRRRDQCSSSSMLNFSLMAFVLLRSSLFQKC